MRLKAAWPSGVRTKGPIPGTMPCPLWVDLSRPKTLCASSKQWPLGQKANKNLNFHPHGGYRHRSDSARIHPIAVTTSRGPKPPRVKNLTVQTKSLRRHLQVTPRGDFFLPAFARASSVPKPWPHCGWPGVGPVNGCNPIGKLLGVPLAQGSGPTLLRRLNARPPSRR